jgi:amino acid transporter/nucleotide-binding universal stress UspA family protein
LLNEIADLSHLGLHAPPNAFAAVFGVVVTIYFWWSNIKGIHESSGKALRIMQITTVMVVAFLIWCPITLLLAPSVKLPPAPIPRNLQFTAESLGWFNGTIWPQIGAIAVVIAFGHSLLSMSGFETLAQVYREIAYPKLKNLRYTGNLVCIYAVVCTGVITLFAGMIIPDQFRKEYVDNLLGGLAMHLAGPPLLRLAFHMFVVVVGVLILSGAVNTSMIGCNGVMNRIAEDGVLLDWFRKPQRRFGTTYRIINLIALLQIATIALSRGDVYLLGEAYAFGVVWSFFLKSVGVLVLRYHRHDQEYKVPFNPRIGGKEIPVGLIVTSLILFLVAIANLFSKRIATIYGVSFTVVLFVIFTISERINARKHKKTGLEEFNLDMRAEITPETVHARPGCVLVAVRDYSHMAHLHNVLEKTNLRRHDIVVMTVRPVSTGAGEYELSDQQLFSDYEKELLSRVVTMAEKEGKTADLIVVPGVDPFDAMVQTAAKLKASRLVTGVSPRMDSDELARRIGLAWEKLPEPRHAFSLEVITADRPSVYVNLGPHPPRLWPQDLDRAHELWLRLQEAFGARLHHRDVIGVALSRLQKDLDSDRREEALSDLEKELRKS